MLITARFRYAVMFMVNLAQSSVLSKGKAKPVRMSNIACNQDLPEGYLEQIIPELKRRGLLCASKGPGGGYYLRVEPNKIMLRDILDAVGDNLKMTRCDGEDDNGCLANNQRCVAHDLWNDLTEYIKDYFRLCSLEDIMTGKLVFCGCSLKKNDRYNVEQDFIYADYNSTAPVSGSVRKGISAMVSFSNLYNPSSMHRLGQDSRRVIEDVRDLARESFNAKDFEVVFTSSGTEANNLVMKGLSNYCQVISAIEHVSVLNSTVCPIIIPVDSDGIIDLSELEKILCGLYGSEILVSVMLANNETGVIQPIKEVVDLAHKFNALVHTDAVQACGKIKIDVQDLGVDLLTFSAHKFGGIAGSGLLLYKNGIKIKPLIDGGGQEKGLRGGAENLTAIFAMSLALNNITEDIRKFDSIKSMRDEMENAILNLVPEAIIFGKRVNRLPNTSFICMPSVKNDTQLMAFDCDNIAVSNGSACSSGKIEPSHVLLAMGINEFEAKCSVRISLGPDFKKEYINKIINCWHGVYRKNVLKDTQKSMCII